MFTLKKMCSEKLAGRASNIGAGPLIFGKRAQTACRVIFRFGVQTLVGVLQTRLVASDTFSFFGKMSVSETHTEGDGPQLDALKSAFVEKVLKAQKARAEMESWKEKGGRIEEREATLAKKIETYVTNIPLDATKEDMEGAFEELVQKPMQSLMEQRAHVARKTTACEELIAECASGVLALSKSTSIPPRPAPKRPSTKLLQEKPAPKRPRKAKKPASRLDLLRKQAVRALPTNAEKAQAKVQRAVQVLKETGTSATDRASKKVSDERRAEILRRNLAAREKREAEAKAKEAKELEEAARRDVERTKARIELEKQKPHLDVTAENDLVRRIDNEEDVEAFFSEDEAASNPKIGAMRDALSRLHAIQSP